MKSSTKYYKKIDYIRAVACIAILLYHLGILKGGFLAVATFFVLSGYLTCISAFKKEKFSIRSYYQNRLYKIYIPLLIVVFCSVAVISFLKNIIWLNLKPETTSVLLGYNNFWQIGANTDYFAHHINSPFIHLWYISILLQFELLFPFIFLFFRYLGNRFHKLVPCIMTAFLAILGTLFFYYMNESQNFMLTYYHTASRIFPLLFGLALGFIHSYYGSMIPKRWKDSQKNIIFYCYLLLLTFLFLVIDAKSTVFAPIMILVTVISCRLLDYSTTEHQKKTFLDHIISFISKISYELYLIQYPVIFISQYLSIDPTLKILFVIGISLLLSYLLHNLFQKPKKWFQYIMVPIFAIITCYGIYQYIIAKDHTEEMKLLEQQLNQNQKLNSLKQKEYAQKLKQEQNDWLAILEDLKQGETKLKEIVSDLSLVGVGDSVMLGAVDNLYQTFPNGYFDAKVSRTAWVVNQILSELKNKNLLGNPVILNLGANGDCSRSCKEDILKTIENRNLFWINVTNDADVHVNTKLSEFASQHNNVFVIDWNSISKGHPEYFYADGIHLTEPGKKEYTKTIYNAIYQVYLKDYHQKKEEIIKKHEDEMKSKISFYGNDMLLNAFEEIHSSFPNSKFVIDKTFTYQMLKQQLETALKEKTLTHKIVLIFDHSFKISDKEYQELITLCSNHKLYMITTNSSIQSNSNTVIPFYQEFELHHDYLMADHLHLTKKGNQALQNIVISTLKE